LDTAGLGQGLRHGMISVAGSIAGEQERQRGWAEYR